MRVRLFAATVLLLIGVGSLTGCSLAPGREPVFHTYTYTGTVTAVCSHTTQGIPDCFALTPDPGTAHRDGYYAGAGAVSFGPPAKRDPIPRIGDHVTVTVNQAVNQAGTVTRVSRAPTA
jgi:hypothetical protein